MTGGIRRLMPRTIRPRRIMAGPLRGLWLVTSWHDYPAGLTGRTEAALLQWLASHVRDGETWLDIGAHYGYTAFALARLVGPTGRVFAFEPVAATAGCLDQGRVLNRLDQLTVLPLGLAAPDTLEMRRLATTRGMADATLGTPGSRAAAPIPVARFDWLWPLIHGGNTSIHGVKIDVQGMELETLEGMRETLSRVRPRLVVELHAGVSRERALRLLSEIGYSRDVEAIESRRGAETALLDDHSYAFHPV